MIQNYWLTDEQKQAVKLLVQSQRGIVWWKVGEGKTRIAIEWILELTEGYSEPEPLIICSPQSFRQWQDEIKLVNASITPVFFSSGMLSTKKGASELSKLITRNSINCLVIDELWMYKNIKTERSKVICQFARQVPTIGLSGSMMTARNIEDLYGQTYAVGLGERLARGLTDFRHQYTIETTNWQGYIERYPKRHALEQIQEKLKDNIHVYFPKETKEIRDIVVNVDPTAEQLRIRKKLVKDYYIEHIDKNGTFTVDIKNAVSLISKLCQVSDGFLYNSERSSLPIQSNKLRKLISICSELTDAGERVLVWFAFRQSIQEALKVSKFKTTILSSNGQFDFEAWSNGGTKICYATIGSGSSLNDFKDVRYSIIYSSSYSYRAMQQARGRTNRKDSQHQCCYYYYLQSVGFPDADVYEMLDESKSAEELTIKRVQQLVNEYELS